MRLCSYVVKHGTGLASNPFWGYCTVAVCTPNQMGIQAPPGDWFMDVTAGQHSGRLVYAIQVSEACVYGKEDGGSDTAVWLAGSKDEAEPIRPGIGESSIAHEAIVALREIGLLDGIIVTKEGLVIYPVFGKRKIDHWAE